MKTRRKSKAAAAAAAAAEQESPTRDPSLAPSASFTIPLPDDLDLEVLSNLIPAINPISPSPDMILSLYKLIIAQASETDATQRDLEEARAEIERKDVELDQSLQDRETATAELETTLEKVQKELTQVKQEKEELATERAALQTQLSALSSTQSVSSTEVDTLKHRVEDTEREKRDLIGVVSRLKEDTTQRDEEIQTLRTNLKQARQEHQSLESQLRELRSSETAAKFKLDSLSQQLQLARDEVERTSTELTSKTEEFAKYRRTKHAELTHLQATHDALVQTHASTETTLKALQSAHTAQSHQLTTALTRVQDLTGQLAEQEATYSTEASGLRRLVTMMEEREAQAKTFVDGLEKQWDEVNDRAERREAVLSEEIDNQRQRAEDAEKRVEELQAVLDRMDRGEFPIPGVASSPGTPMTPARGPSTPARNGTADLLTQGMMGLSPTVAMASRAQRSGKTFTEVYSDYIRLQEEFSRKCAEYDHMDRTLAAVLAQIEERAPVLTQQRIEYERLQSEASQLASQLAQALAERDAYAAASEENAQKFARSARENELLQKQLGDLGRQVQVLLKDLGRVQDPSIPPDSELELDEASRPADNIEAVITNNLVLFRSIPALQEQNQKLLKIVRELGAKLESEEKEYRETLEQEQGEAVREAHEAIKQLQEQLETQKKSSEVTIQAYMKERDTFKSMLARSEGDSASKGVNGQANGVDRVSPADSDLAKELAEVQTQFAAYKSEMGVDAVRLREELIHAQREANQLGATLAKAHAKIEFLNDRHRMVQEENLIQNRELNDLTKRNQQLYDQYTRIEIECNKVSEDLISTSGLVEQLRNECANLRAEKKIWEGVQGRLVEENKALAIERSHLSDLMANVQKMHNDLERSGENDRRRLESQMQMLENQTHDLRSQLNQERESVRRLTLQKDIEFKQLHERIDKSTQELSKTREALIGAETSKKHLEERVEQLTRQLQGNEEKLAVYERRASGVNGIAQRTDEDMTREQQLETEVADLRSALKVAEDSTEAELARRKSDYDALQQKLQSTEQQLAQLTEKHSELERTYDRERLAWADDKRTLEGTIIDMSTSEKHSESDRASRESAVRQQEERAKAAEERYGREVLAHAEALKAVEDLRRQLSKSQAAVREHLAAAETAQAKLAGSESSWRQQKDALTKEVADLNARCQDLAEQNNVLHHHLESVSSQAARIKQAADSSSNVTSGEAEFTDDTDTKLSELRSVVAYLRKEKEIVDLQLELSKQENTRLKTQIEHLSQNLEETRKALSEEREQAAQAATSDAQHADLIERINQLTILRESNATLRADCEAHAKRARDLDTKFRQVSAELDPTKEQLRVAQAELESKDQQVERLENETRRWQERNSQLLTKYDRIDPAEVQSLQEEIEQLKTAKADLEKSAEERDAQNTANVHKFEAEIQRMKEVNSKNNTTARNRFEKDREERERLEVKIKELNTSLESMTKERDELQTRAQTTVSDVSKDHELNQRINRLASEKLALEKSLASEKAAKEASSTKLAELSAEIATLRQERDRLRLELQTATSSTSQAEIISRHARELHDLEERLTKQHQQELKAAVEAAAAAARQEISNRPPAKPEDTQAVVQAAIAAHEYQMKDQREQEIAAAMEAGRKEVSVKAKLKDQVLVKTQNRLKELEAQVLEWQKEGLIPESPTSSASKPAGATPSASTSQPSPATASTSAAPIIDTTATTSATVPSAPSPQSGLPRKPSMHQPPPEHPGRGRGRGVRGGGHPPRGAGRDGAHPGDEETGGISIMGAAGKRTREEDAPASDNVAKRLKPEGTGRPVQLRRDRVPPPP
ncbi:Nucleoprotein TPR [Grifola frondosa]|uniref:Nucleoprotein TPR n=1 Tax=Grifola frondosa TaxID=5627 RepID=A0A1C7LVJ6_GRIFR|nr:Nucleoprotein TPR [Grifola frondosa]